MVYTTPVITPGGGGVGGTDPDDGNDSGTTDPGDSDPSTGQCPDGEYWDPAFGRCLPGDEDSTSDQYPEDRGLLMNVSAGAHNWRTDGNHNQKAVQLYADVVNGRDSEARYSVKWYLGKRGRLLDQSNRVSIPRSEEKTLTGGVSVYDLYRDGVQPGQYTLYAKLGTKWLAGPRITLHEKQTADPDPGDGTTDPGDGGSTPGGGSESGGLLPDGVPLLPAVGPLTREQTTIGAGLGLVFLLLVVR